MSMQDDLNPNDRGGGHHPRDPRLESADRHGPPEPGRVVRSLLGESAPSRRRFLALGALAAIAAGCESTQRVSRMPDPVWPKEPVVPTPAPSPTSLPGTPPPSPRPMGPPTMPGVIPRAAWAKGDPVPSMMNKMTPVKHITIHHDGMTPFLAVDQASSVARIELIRTGHRNRPDPWGDIGYHFIVDRAGRVYEGRPLVYQGAHVKNHNEGNIGILCLGNFEAQAPSDAQLRAVAAHVQSVRHIYSVQVANVHTHREWQGAQTLCPGRSLQSRVGSMRSNRAFA
ncbi:MAG: N-acetylmuramoyl-L-alanine amidase [Phycisphaerales bacterium]|nr:N-acetylmuramoyl-L-alanine amidase [Phycisphaerales bacterium]